MWELEMPVDLVGMRHKESENNAAFKYAQETKDASFLEKLERTNRPDANDRGTRRGATQVKTASQWIQTQLLRGRSFDAHFTSDMVRAQETALELDFPGAVWQESPHLFERDWGEFFRKAPDHEEAHRDLFDQRAQDSWHWRPQGGEKLSHGLVRVYLFLNEELPRYNEKSVFFTSHGEYLEKLMFVLCGMTRAEYHARHRSKRAEDKIHNCTIHHYSRRNPTTGVVESRLNWMRTITPHISPEPSPWRRIGRKALSHADLRRHVEAYERVLDF